MVSLRLKNAVCSLFAFFIADEKGNKKGRVFSPSP